MGIQACLDERKKSFTSQQVLVVLSDTVDLQSQQQVGNLDQEMQARLAEAGARTGRDLTISLMWDQQPPTDLDLHVQVPNAAEIYHGRKRSGGGYLDVDMMADKPKPVENVFFDTLAPGQYRCFVRNFNGCASKAFKCVLRSN